MENLLKKTENKSFAEFGVAEGNRISPQATPLAQNYMRGHAGLVRLGEAAHDPEQTGGRPEPSSLPSDRPVIHVGTLFTPRFAVSRNPLERSQPSARACGEYRVFLYT